MRIALIGQKGIPSIAGGIEKHVEQLALGLKRAGHVVQAYVRSTYPGADAKQWQGIEIIRVKTVDAKNLNAIVYSFFATIQAMRSKPDIIHYHGTGPAVMAFLPRIFTPKITLICTYHSDDTKHQKWSVFARIFFRLAKYLAVKLPHNTIAVSKAQLSDILQTAPQARVTYIPNGASKPVITAPGKTLQRFNLTSDRYILFTGRLVRHKGVHTLIAAFKKLQPQFLDYKLVIVGGSSYTDNYVEAVKKLSHNDPRIVFTGQIDNPELYELMSNAALYVHPAVYEGLSISILEALSYGLITLVSDIAPNLEAAGTVGFSFKTEDTKDLTICMEQLLKLPNAQKQTIKQNTAAFAAEHYDWDIIIKQTLEIYSQTLAARKT